MELRAMFPRDNVTPARLAGYERELRDVPPELLWRTVREVIRSRTYPSFPLVGELREVAARHALALPTEAEALGQVEARMRHARDYRQGPPPEPHPLVREALQRVGGYA